MDKKYNVTDAELEIMKALWKLKCATFQELVDELQKDKPKNKNTIKTLLYRLQKKGAVDAAVFEEIEDDFMRYFAEYEEEEYLEKENERFLNKLYKGSANNLLLNFAKEKKISKEEVQKLLDILED